MGQALSNCTIAGNACGTGGSSYGDGAVDGFDGAGAGTYGGSLANCIVYFNSTSTGANYENSDLDYSCTIPMPSVGIGNITNDPQLVSVSGFNYELLPGSPCIDAGTNLDWMVGSVDFSGTVRVLDGDDDAMAVVDMGAFEHLNPIADSNGDGIPDGWTVDHGLDSTDPTVAVSNPDFDPFTTGDEYIADTDPTNEASYFRITAIDNTPSPAVFVPTSSNRVYTLHRRTNTTEEVWSEVPGQIGVPGSGNVDALTDTNFAHSAMYSVEVDLP